MQHVIVMVQWVILGSMWVKPVYWAILPSHMPVSILRAPWWVNWNSDCESIVHVFTTTFPQMQSIYNLVNPSLHFGQVLSPKLLSFSQNSAVAVHSSVGVSTISFPSQASCVFNGCYVLSIPSMGYPTLAIPPATCITPLSSSPTHTLHTPSH